MTYHAATGPCEHGVVDDVCYRCNYPAIAKALSDARNTIITLRVELALTKNKLADLQAAQEKAHVPA